MNPKLSKIILSIAILAFSKSISYAQMKPSFDVRFLKAKITDTINKKDVIVIFHISIKDTADYPPIFKLPPKCSIINKGIATDVTLTPENLALLVDDDKIILRNIYVYDLIKNMVDFNDKNHIIILSFKLKDISSDEIKKMRFTFALGEKRIRNSRIEKTFEFDVEQ